MPINFHDEQNRQTYATRNADESWISLIKDPVDISNKRIADVGCGGGIYTKALIRGSTSVAVIRGKVDGKSSHYVLIRS